MAFRASSFGTVHYREAGQAGGLPIVFCNSLGTDARIWDLVIDDLAPDYRLISYDKRGHGLSSVPSGPYDIDQLSADLLELVDSLGIERFAVAGVSVGGMIAQRFALDHPDRLTGLVLCDTAAKVGDAAFWSDRMARVAAGGVETIADAGSKPSSISPRNSMALTRASRMLTAGYGPSPMSRRLRVSGET